jgi:alkylation response protein AidB-like acyl-CoA dehydrogenase
MDFNLNDEQHMWRDAVHDFVTREVKSKARETDEHAEFNWEAVKKMGSFGLLGLNVPEKYGGSDMDAISAAIAIEELGWACGSTALSIGAHNGLGCSPLANWGSEELKTKYLIPAASGSGKLAALALTEPGAGSDLQGGVKTKAVKDGDQWVINGAKSWCTNACIAEYILTLAITDPEAKSGGFSLILVPPDTPGLSIGPPEKKMGVKGSPTNAITYQDVHVPLTNLIGEEGKGLIYSLSTLDGGRISIAALSVGLAQAALEEAVQYSKDREAFGAPIANLQAIQWMLAEGAAEINAARLMTYQAAFLKEKEKPFTKEAAMAKMFASETAERVCRNAIQVHGGYGYSSEYPVERMYRDARLMTIGEGTSEVLRMVIARSVLKD